MKRNELSVLRFTSGQQEGRYFCEIKKNRVLTAWTAAGAKHSHMEDGFKADIEQLNKRGKQVEVVRLTENLDASILANLQELIADDYQEIEVAILELSGIYHKEGSDICTEQGNLKAALPALEKGRRLKAFAEFCKQMRERGEAL